MVIPQLILNGVFVSYDRLSPNFSSVSGIPWYGELITARWAFEGLAVNQFCRNNYQKEFFIYEKLKSNANYRKDFWVPAMHCELSKYTNLQNDSAKEQVKTLLNHEISGVLKQLPRKPEFETPPVFTHKEISDPEIQETGKFLNNIKKFYIGLYNRADQKEEAHRQQLIKAHPEKGNQYLTDLRDQYHNEGLERFARGTDDFFSKRIIRHNNRFIQKFDAIYKEPAHKYLKAHFMAPFKNTGAKQLDTFWANLAVIWLMNIVLFILLYSKTLSTLLKKGKKVITG
jgi:hypothetical protein